MFYFEIVDTMRDFLERGGTVLWVILFATLLLWTFIFDRLLFFKKDYPYQAKKIYEKWSKRQDRHSWHAHQIRNTLLSQAGQKLFQHISTIKTLVALCPLLGLLGTVTGMISVFDIMAITGTGNARLMASGISMATIPTMAGMVAALSGVYFSSLLETKAKRLSEALADKLTFEK